MRKGLTAVGLLAVLGAVTGCSDAYIPKPFLTLLKDESAFSSAPSLQHTLILDRKTRYVTCTMPQPDATFSQAEEGDIMIALINTGGNDSGGQEEESNESEMAGRSPAVLITRELFFRLCEFSRNYQLEKGEAMELYKTTLDAVKDGWKAEAANTKVNIGDTVSTGQTTGAVSLPQLQTRTSGTTGSSTSGTSTTTSTTTGTTGSTSQ